MLTKVTEVLNTTSKGFRSLASISLSLAIITFGMEKVQKHIRKMRARTHTITMVEKAVTSLEKCSNTVDEVLKEKSTSKTKEEPVAKPAAKAKTTKKTSN